MKTFSFDKWRFAGRLFWFPQKSLGHFWRSLTASQIPEFWVDTPFPLNSVRKIEDPLYESQADLTVFSENISNCKNGHLFAAWWDCFDWILIYMHNYISFHVCLSFCCLISHHKISLIKVSWYVYWVHEVRQSQATHFSFHHLHTVSPKQLCALEHVGCTHRVGTS